MDAISPDEFDALLKILGIDFSKERALAVAVSGGPDSMALGFLLSRWAHAQKNPPVLHILIVDHGLRPESGEEARGVFEIVQDWPCVRAYILRWDHAGISSKLQEEARRARYALMTQYCKVQGIAHLFLGHHQDDQAETFLIRLAKGSGLTGLCAMRPVSLQNDVMWLRPFLDVPKARLLETCAMHHIKTVQDPSNDMERFSRVRLRKSRAVLEGEGLSAQRLSRTAKRLLRVQMALEEITEKSYKDLVIFGDTERIVLNLPVFRDLPEEIAFRCLCRGVDSLKPQAEYPPRMERMETVFDDMIRTDAFRKRALAGVVFERKDKAQEIYLTREK